MLSSAFSHLRDSRQVFVPQLGISRFGHYAYLRGHPRSEIHRIRRRIRHDLCRLLIEHHHRDADKLVHALTQVLENPKLTGPVPITLEEMEAWCSGA